ncbi:dermonecrotic toxin domain-containing protein [Pseudomonas salmasensis]|uniref:dermonecrotic toxin domain-containing protein n=1 Tax=Pseudomonas salmasensis TaxID=2745514 RepID=UPI0016472BB4|nr:DUF6543 domain-containing protein [Pseudomonas salmasensis]QXH76749.1 hypothetical protein HU731_020255 [Pseudomonas salmasensis]
MSLSLNPTPSLSLPPVIVNPTSNTQAQAIPASSPPTAETIHPDETALLKAYLEAVQRKVLHGNAGLITVPPQSTLGQWLGLYRTLVENNVVQGWLREQHVTPDTLLSINPSTGTLSFEVSGKKKTFHLSDTSGWGQISGPLLAAAKVIAPGNNGELRVRLGNDAMQVSAKVVANFEGVPLPKTLSQARAQIRHLEHKETFDPIAANDPLRPAGSRSALALQVQKHNAANYYSSAPQALAYKRLAVDVANNLPNTRAEAKKWADGLLLTLTGKPIDSDTVYLNRFKGGESADTATSWEHTFQEPWSSLRLPDALLKNFSEHDWVPGNLDLEAGLYTQPAGQSDKGGYGKHNQIALKPSQVMHESWKTDFQTQMTQKIDHFWNTHNDEYETAIKGEFIFQARKQLKSTEGRSALERSLQAPEHQLTRDDYRLVMGAVSNVALDENTPLALEQLKAKAPTSGNLRANALSLHGVTSSDIVRFSEGDGGRQVLYIPGAEPAFVRFDSVEKLDQWLVEQAKDPAKREALAAHFPMIYRQDQTKSFGERAAKVLMPILWFTHVGEKKDGLDTLLAKMASGELKGSAIDRSHAAIKDDVFSTLATAAKERMNSDADVVIKSNSEVIRDTWLNDVTVAAGLLAKLAPIAAPVAAAAVVAGLAEVALGAEKTTSGDTVTERDEGATKAFDGLLNTLFSYGASAVPEDPFALPAEKQLPRLKPQTLPELNAREPQPGPSTGTPVVIDPINAPLPRSRSLIPMAQYAVPEGEQLIKNAPRDALGVYRITDNQGALRQFVRLTDETGASKVFEISGRYRTGDAFARVINPDNGAGLMVITPGRDGEWARAPGDGGVKWPWQRTVSPPKDPEVKISPKISDNFVGLEGEKLAGAERFDELLKNSGRQNFDFSTRNVNSNGIDQTKLEVSWEVPDNDFAVGETEKAGPADYGTSQYSDQFVKDVNRSTYRVEVKTGGAPHTVELNQGGASTEDIRRARITQFETLIPNPDLRARISEVAHQGAMAEVSAGFMSLEDTELKEGFRLKVDIPSYTIIYDPTSEVTEVNAIGIGHIQDIERGIDPVPGIEVTLTKRFKILATNDVSEPFKIDQSAPARASLMVAPLPEKNTLAA